MTPRPAPPEFELDRFQREAIDALDRGESVLVAAPTGAGKTVVAEHAVELALRERGKAFYTTPIKALSNQKYGDLVARHGADRVGLLTGDNAINAEAEVVVMTTEVLRNMIYAASPLLEGLRFVVLDEVHYLQDTYRGPVWEEVIVHLGRKVQLVCLSATVSNATEVADWLATVRGATALVLEQERPVELRNLYLVGDRTGDTEHLLPILVDGEPNPEGDRTDGSLRNGRNGKSGGSGQGRNGAGRNGNGRRSRWYTPRRPEVIRLLEEHEMLPGLYFIFSRAACEDAVRSCVEAGIRLVGPEERDRIRMIVEQHTAGLTRDDLAVLGYSRWAEALERGIAAHHAGMVPPFKEAVEACFAAGLVKAVFATETLALGVNMPARSVVIERLSKFTGERRAFLTPGEYTQITGRAGRRGIDNVGYAVVLWSPWVPFAQVAELAASRSYALRSAFRPTYNMATNLVARYEPTEAHRLLNLSFGQFQADRAVVDAESRAERTRRKISRLRAEATCDRGSVEEYHRLRSAAGARLKAERRAADREIELALVRLAPGDVVDVDGVRLAVLSVAQRKKGVRMRAIDSAGRDLRVGATALVTAPRRVGKVDLPTPYQPNQRTFRTAVARALAASPLGSGDGTGKGAGRTVVRNGTAEEPGRADPLGRDDPAGGDGGTGAEDHPVAACPDRDAHVRALMKAERAERELAKLQRDVRNRTETLARRFDRVLELLEAWGYLDGWELTDRGQVLARTYHESDLLVAEALSQGLLDGLDPATLAGLVSTFVYEHRGPDTPPEPWFPSRLARSRWAAVEALYRRLAAEEEAIGLTVTRAPEAGFLALAYAWAGGEPLAEVLADEDLTGGDFVRVIRMVIDLLRQIADVAPRAATALAARQAATALQRGAVVAATPAVPEGAGR
jgi:ATP-dependent RNA helicase HelY